MSDALSRARAARARILGLAVLARARRRRPGRGAGSSTTSGAGGTDELIELADRLDIADIVTFTGKVPDEVVAEVLSTADLGLSPEAPTP